jgi:hypothetical protein
LIRINTSHDFVGAMKLGVSIAVVIGGAIAFSALLETTRQANIAEDTDKRQLRAYVFSTGSWVRAPARSPSSLS